MASGGGACGMMGRILLLFERYTFCDTRFEYMGPACHYIFTYQLSTTYGAFMPM